MKKIRLLMVAGEASGDLHGAHLASALFGKSAELDISGIGGTLMLASGVNIIYDIKNMAVVGIVEVASHWRAIKDAFRRAQKHIEEHACDGLILIDYPDFNLRLAEKAKKAGVPVYYFVSPQIWAWRAGRIDQIARLVDKMMVILPFEKQIYDAKGIDCSFVGHPLLDEVFEEIVRPETEKKIAVLPRPLIALFPGSRASELSRLLKPMAASMSLLKKRIPGCGFVLALAPSFSHEQVMSVLNSFDVECELIAANPNLVLKEADLAIVASGTTTLQAAIAQTPMVVVYKVSPVTFFIARRLVRINHIALANLVAGKRVVPELVQHDVTHMNIADEAVKILTDEELYENTRFELSEVAKKLGSPGCAGRTADIILKSLHEKK